MLNFANLNDLEFEYLCKDIMSEILQVRLQRFGAGQDDGIDLTDNPYRKNIVVQVKHYSKTDARGLIASLKKEVPKVQSLHPTQYYVCCSKELTPQNKNEIYTLFQDYMDSPANIITLVELNDFLEQEEHAEILRRHFKLWLESTNILTTIFTNDICVDSDAMLYDIQNRAKLFVQTKAYNQARDCLEKNRVLIIIGAPGVGKSITSQMLVLSYAAQGYRVRYTSDGADLAGLKRALSQSRDTKEVILLDDCFGQAYFSMKETQENELLALIRYVRMSPNKVLIMNSRVTIYREAQERTQVLMQSRNQKEYQVYILDMSNTSDVEKAKIFYNHLYFGEVPKVYRDQIRKEKRYLKIVQHVNYNPRIVEFVCSKGQIEHVPADQYFDFVMQCLNYPEQIWKNEYERRLTEPDRLLLNILYSLTNTTISLEQVRQCYEYRSSRTSGLDHSINHFQQAVARLQESMIQIVDRYGKKMLSVSNPSVNDFLHSYLEQNRSERLLLVENSHSVRPLYRLLDENEREERLEQLFQDGSILAYVFENEKEKRDFIVNYCVRHNIKDRRYQPYMESYVMHLHDITDIDGHSIPLRFLIWKLFKSDMCHFYHLDQIFSDMVKLHEILCDLFLEDMIEVIRCIDHLFVEEKREAYISLVREELKESMKAYCEEVPAADYDIDAGSIVEDYHFYDEDGDHIDDASAAQEINRIVEGRVREELYKMMDKLPKDLTLEDVFVEELDIWVSGSDDMVGSYLSDFPDDYYEELWDRENSNGEIEYIFER